MRYCWANRVLDRCPHCTPGWVILQPNTFPVACETCGGRSNIRIADVAKTRADRYAVRRVLEGEKLCAKTALRVVSLCTMFLA
jgi:hypothetical protein